MRPRASLAELALGDALAGAADDLRVMLRSVDARRLALHMVELLGCAGWRLVRDGLDGDERIGP